MEAGGAMDAGGAEEAGLEAGGAEEAGIEAGGAEDCFIEAGGAEDCFIEELPEPLEPAHLPPVLRPILTQPV
jgi:hypothetical protein